MASQGLKAAYHCYKSTILNIGNGGSQRRTDARAARGFACFGVARTSCRHARLGLLSRPLRTSVFDRGGRPRRRLYRRKCDAMGALRHDWSLGDRLRYLRADFGRSHRLSLRPASTQDRRRQRSPPANTATPGALNADSAWGQARTQLGDAAAGLGTRRLEQVRRRHGQVESPIGHAAARHPQLTVELRATRQARMVPRPSSTAPRSGRHSWRLRKPE